MPAAALAVRTSQRFASGVTVAPDFTVALRPGAVLVVFGPSGAGKSTVLRQIAGLETPGEGAIRFGDRVWFDARNRIDVAPQERRAALVFQSPALFPHLTVRENIAYGAAKDRGRVDQLARELGIEPLLTRMPRALSGGEAQRVALARALAPNPRLLLLDEPFASLDAPARARLRRDLRTILARTNTPAVLVTHDRAEALAIGDHTAELVDGRVRQTGEISNVFNRPADAAVAASLGVEAVLPARVTAVDNGLIVVDVHDTRLNAVDRGEPDNPMAAGDEVYACVRAEDVTLEATSTEKVGSARNHLRARVVGITPEGPMDRVALDCGFALDALITRRSREEMRIAEGTEIVAAIKATSIHVVPRA